jgi:fructosamine-3-kinase
VSLAEDVGAAAGSEVTASRRVGGGSINEAYAVELADGRRAFVKTRADAPADEYASEAASLAWLAEPGAVRVPAVVGVGESFLALEWIEPGAGDDEALGRGLAMLHAAGASSFGRTAPPFGACAPLRIGTLTLDAQPADDWPAFYAERLVRPLIAPARDRGALSGRGAQAVERVCDRMAELAGPPQPPARLHGDLWTGNVLGDWLIDPIAYGGHREVDLAMLRLFGSPSRRFEAAYDEVAPLADGAAGRVELYQLFPLMVHTVLFGGGYGGSAERAALRYSG